jgi:hypothetical protein
MSQQDLWIVIGRAKVDSGFATALFKDFEGALKANGYVLTADELRIARTGGSGAVAASQPLQSPVEEDQGTWKLQQKEMSRRIKAQSDRMIDLSSFTVKTLQDTIQHATGTYKKITMMNEVMFWMGVVLFLFAVGYAVYTHDLVYSAAFAGLGTASFIGVFFLGPIGKTQAALSNLISAEIAFMSYFEQMWLIEGFASMPRNDLTGLPDPVRVEKASELMQLRSSQTSELLHRYLEHAKDWQVKPAEHGQADHGQAGHGQKVEGAAGPVSREKAPAAS